MKLHAYIVFECTPKLGLDDLFFFETIVAEIK